MDVVIHSSGSEVYVVVLKGSAGLHSQNPGDDMEWTDIENFSDLGADCDWLYIGHLLIVFHSLIIGPIVLYVNEI